MNMSREIISLFPADESLTARTHQYTLALNKTPSDWLFLILPKHLKQMKHNYAHLYEPRTISLLTRIQSGFAENLCSSVLQYLAKGNNMGSFVCKKQN